MSSITTADGLSLEARWDDASGQACGVVVFCHPHPLHAGSMSTPLMEKVTAALVAGGLHVLRFNFRGVGSSEGSWGEGIGEIDDVDAAVTAARLSFEDLPIGLAGWSFGASTSLAWQQRTGSTLPWAGIAPGIRGYEGADPPVPETLEPADRLVVMGDRDQFASVEQMTDYADRLGARLEILEGSDHFFWYREEKVAGLVADHLCQRLRQPG
jgi:alpha/beta superfamily hydrolase